MDGQDRSRWHDIGYLQQGSEAQRRAYRILTDRQILQHLEPYDAVLAGTFPLQHEIGDLTVAILEQSTCASTTLRKNLVSDSVLVLTWQSQRCHIRPGPPALQSRR